MTTATATKPKKADGKSAASGERDDAKEKPARKRGEQNPIDVSCEFSGVSIGDGTARLSVKIPRSSLLLTRADEFLTGRRIECQVTLTRQGAEEGQEELFDDADLSIAGVADVRRLGVSVDWFSTGLTFNLKEIHIEELAKFSKGNGRFVVVRSEKLPDDQDSD